jgi:glucose-6-phosphate dehydrogenase assembly protein OpcA
MSAPPKPEAILRELQQLWTQLAQDQAESGGVLKACAMTLVIAAQDEKDAARVRQILGVLMHHHPSRAIVVQSGEAGAHDLAPLDARVFAECWMPFGRNQQICSEGIEITAGAAGLEEAARFLVPLRVPDLPAVLWCRGAEALAPGPLDALYPLADKIVFDSRKAADARAAVDFLRGLKAAGRRVADLHWARLTGWRETLAHLFDDGAMRPEEVKSVWVGFGGSTVTTCALYLAAWIRSALPGVPVENTVEQAVPGLSSITLRTAGCSLRLERAGDTCLHVEGCGRSYRTLLPAAGEEAVMREELSIHGPDPVWERVLSA